MKYNSFVLYMKANAGIDGLDGLDGSRQKRFAIRWKNESAEVKEMYRIESRRLFSLQLEEEQEREINEHL